jgi:DNA-binding IclR family transcriptional regulator
MTRAQRPGSRPLQSTQEGRRSKTVANATRLLHALGQNGSPMGVTELATQLSLGRSTVHLLLQTLCDARFVEVDDDTGRYRIGVGAFEVGTAALEHLRLGVHLDPPMERLAELSREAVSLAIRSGDRAVIVKRFESTHVLRADIRVGTRMPLHASASGKCLLAGLPGEKIDELFPGQRLPDVTPETLQTKRELLREVERVRQRGYALNRNEFLLGVAAAAVPVHDGEGRVHAALSIAGPTARFDAEGWVERLTRTAEEMSPGIDLYAGRNEVRT